MTENIFHAEFAHITYWFLTGLSLDIIFSIFYSFKGGLLRSRFSGKISGTGRAVIVIILIGFVVYISDRFFSEPTISLLIDLEDSIFPLSVFSIAFNAFYFIKFVLERKWRFHDTITTLSISVITLVVTFYMIFNGNTLL